MKITIKELEKRKELQELFNEIIYHTKNYENYFYLVGNRFSN